MGHILGYCQMINMEDRFCLNWSGYDENIREYFRQLRGNQRFFDVTLVTDDGQHIQAHKIILSAGSNFFSDIFLKSHQTNMVIYLKGINSVQLEKLLDFLYNGEASVGQKELKEFLETGKELQVKGFEAYVAGLGESEQEEAETYFNKDEGIHENGDNINGKNIICDTLEPSTEKYYVVDANLQQRNEKMKKIQVNSNDDLDF